MKNILTLLMMIIPIWGFSQSDSGYVQFYIYPDDCDIKLNNSFSIGSKSKIKLPVGENSIQISRKLLQKVADTFVVFKDSAITYRKILYYDDDYVYYQKKLNAYHLHRYSVLTVGILNSVLTAYLSYSIYSNYKNKENQALENGKFYQSKYENSFTIEDMNNYKNLFETEKNNYYKYRKQKFNSVPILVIGSGISYFTYWYFSKIKKPKYIEQISLNYSYQQDKLNHFTITYKF